RAATEHRARAALADDAECQRADHEQDGANRRRARQHRRTGPRAKCRLAAAAAKRGRDVAALALLQVHDEHHRQTREDVENGDQVVQHAPSSCWRKTDYTAALRLRETMSANAFTSRLAPPTSAPSTSG